MAASCLGARVAVNCNSSGDVRASFTIFDDSHHDADCVDTCVPSSAAVF